MAGVEWSRKTSDIPERLLRQLCPDRALRPAPPGAAGSVPAGAMPVLAHDRDGHHDSGSVVNGRRVGPGWHPPASPRWRHAPDVTGELSGRYLSFEEREEIVIMRSKDRGVREIARALGRDPETISRELRRNAAARAAKQEYRAARACRGSGP